VDASVVVNVRDSKGRLLEAVQETPAPLAVEAAAVRWAATVHLQTPLSQLGRDSPDWAVFFELRHWKAAKRAVGGDGAAGRRDQPLPAPPQRLRFQGPTGRLGARQPAGLQASVLESPCPHPAWTAQRSTKAWAMIEADELGCGAQGGGPASPATPPIGGSGGGGGGSGRRALEVYAKPPSFGAPPGGRAPRLLTSKPMFLVVSVHVARR
jgi:hypothetical protein